MVIQRKWSWRHFLLLLFVNKESERAFSSINWSIHWWLLPTILLLCFLQNGAYFILKFLLLSVMMFLPFSYNLLLTYLRFVSDLPLVGFCFEESCTQHAQGLFLVLCSEITLVEAQRPNDVMDWILVWLCAWQVTYLLYYLWSTNKKLFDRWSFVFFDFYTSFSENFLTLGHHKMFVVHLIPTGPNLEIYQGYFSISLRNLFLAVVTGSKTKIRLLEVLFVIVVELLLDPLGRYKWESLYIS